MTQAGSVPDNGREGKARRKSELAIRIVSAVALAALAIGATIYQPWTFLVLVMVGSLLVAWEWGRLTRGNGFDGTALVAAVSVAAVAIFVSLDRPGLSLFVFGAAATVIGVTTFPSGRAGWALTGLAYAALPAAALVWLRGDPAWGAAAVLYLFAVAWTTDTASYAAGRLIGGPKLAPRISPNKTWSGFIVGALTPALVGYAFAEALKETSAMKLSLVSVVLALACQMGDLIESAVKRRFGAKDASQMIPGHGGLLDRIDGLLLAAIVAALIALRDPASPGRGLLIW
ncbi:MAG: phosphatidate cytidylyltransferase [Methyloceanibacter sp.]